MINLRSTFSFAHVSDLWPSCTVGLFFSLKHTAIKGKLENIVVELMMEKILAVGFRKQLPESARGFGHVSDGKPPLFVSFGAGVSV